MNYGNKMNQGGRLYDYMKAGGKLMGRQGYKIGEGGMRYMDEGGQNGDGENGNGDPSAPAKERVFGKDEPAYSNPGDREKGTIYYDEDAQGFFEVFDTQTGTQARAITGGQGDMERVFDYIVEQGGGKDAIGFPSTPDTQELFEKYPQLYDFKTDAEGNPITDRGGKKINMGSSVTGAGMKSKTKAIIQTALTNGDPLLMSMLLNPYSDGASKVFENIQPYAIERVENTGAGADRGIQFQSLNLVGTKPGQDQHWKEYGPGDVQRKQIFPDDEETAGQLIVDPESGETVSVTTPMETPGFGEGVPSTNPDVPRTRAEGAVPYQKKFGGMIRKANEGMRMQRRTVFRFPRS